MWNKDATVLLKLGKPTAIGGRGYVPGRAAGASDLEKKKISGFSAQRPLARCESTIEVDYLMQVYLASTCACSSPTGT